MASSRASASRPWLILAALEAVCFGPYFRSIGFYLDDWLHLELAGDGKTGLLASMRAFAARGGFSARPLDVPYFALFMSAGGAHPTFYRAVLVVLHLAVVALFYLLCREFSDDRELSLLSAALGLALPLGDASELWWSVSQQMLATALILASLWRHAKRSRAGHRGPAELVLSQLLYLLALLLYEGGIAFPLFLG
ncbi:MAG TPA: hypothetical protein VNI01_00380, partial [Elusimicrobiota bacterium]|nr:hypothetical protein [Elusimicrobiota bacterium]